MEDAKKIEMFKRNIESMEVDLGNDLAIAYRNKMDRMAVRITDELNIIALVQKSIDDYLTVTETEPEVQPELPSPYVTALGCSLDKVFTVGEILDRMRLIYRDHTDYSAMWLNLKTYLDEVSAGRRKAR